ncbi:MAG: RagB/SusD family nutrient uptake outer membrane protein, partial [Flavobacteriales bacterium]
AIYRCNVVLGSFDLVSNLSEEDRTRMEAEARFVRAVSHFGAVRLYAQPFGATADNSHLGVPLRLTAESNPLPRATVGEVYAAIVEDLEFAAANLPETNGVYATRDAAEGYLAHVRFLMGDYAVAAEHATNVIASGRYTLDGDLDRYDTDVVNPETVFGIVSMPFDFRSNWFRDNLRSDGNPNPQLAFSEDFAFFMSLAGGGDGRSAWVSAGARPLCNRFNGKEYFNVPVVHLTGLMLLRAEALAESGGDLGTAISDINAIRDRAFGAGNNSLDAGSDAQAVIAAARDEYRKETAGEGAWTDQLLRRGAAGEDITIRGATWSCPGMSLQFPNNETTSAGFVLNEEGGCL